MVLREEEYLLEDYIMQVSLGEQRKRSHRHSYNANSGFGIIIGKATGKLLHMWGIPKEKHVSLKNWNSSSPSEMETKIILVGCYAAEKIHGVRYMRFIGDGNSFVYPTLLVGVAT